MCGGEFLKVVVVYAVITWGGTRGLLFQNSFNKPRGDRGDVKGFNTSLVRDWHHLLNP